MRYSIEPKERRYVKGYGFFSFARNIGTHATKVAKNLNNKYDQKLVNTAKKSATDALKIAGKRAIHKTAEPSGDYDYLKKKKQQMDHTQMQLPMKYQKKDIYFHKK